MAMAPTMAPMTMPPTQQPEMVIEDEVNNVRNVPINQNITQQQEPKGIDNDLTPIVRDEETGNIIIPPGGGTYRIGGNRNAQNNMQEQFSKEGFSNVKGSNNDVLTNRLNDDILGLNEQQNKVSQGIGVIWPDSAGNQFGIDSYQMLLNYQQGPMMSGNDLKKKLNR